MVKEIPLQNGMVALVDDEDFERVSNYIWKFGVSGNSTSNYIASYKYSKGRKEVIRLSHLILGEDINTSIDVVIYIDNNPLNNCKENLKIIPKKHLNHYKRGNKNGSSKYKGVHWDKRDGAWRASIQISGKTFNLGRFHNEDEAARAYNQAAIKHFGEHAYQNIIGESNNSTIIEIVPKRKHKSLLIQTHEFDRLGGQSNDKTISKP